MNNNIKSDIQKTGYFCLPFKKIKKKIIKKMFSASTVRFTLFFIVE